MGACPDFDVAQPQDSVQRDRRCLFHDRHALGHHDGRMCGDPDHGVQAEGRHVVEEAGQLLQHPAPGAPGGIDVHAGAGVVRVHRLHDPNVDLDRRSFVRARVLCLWAVFVYVSNYHQHRILRHLRRQLAQHRRLLLSLIAL